MSTNSLYAAPKRRKPVQKRVRNPAEGAKSNPSKRHRDRLNQELEHLANLLPFPQDVISKLDKLSVLRLSVSYLRLKSFFHVALKSDSCQKPETCSLNQPEPNFLDGELLLQVLNGFVLVATSDGVVFYVSPTIQDYLGFHQCDIIHQNVYDLIHADDRPEFQRQLHWALDPNFTSEADQESSDGSNVQLPSTYYYPEQLPPQNSTFLERNFVCRVRCLLDNTAGFIAMNFQGHLKFLHLQNRRTNDGLPSPAQLALFAIVSPLQPPSILEIRTKSLMFRTKHKLDFTPTACDSKGKAILGYTEAELFFRGTGYQFIHAADMLHCAENHIRMMKTGESGLTVFRLLTKQSGWMWVQANARLIHKNGKPECIIATQRVLTDEEGEESLSKRNLKLPFGFTSGEAVLYDTNGTFMEGESSEGKGVGSLNPDSILGAMLKQDESAYVCVPAQNPIPLQPGVLTDCGENQVFTGDWQADILSLSENGIFKREPIINSMEDNSDLSNFMKALGISREDVNLVGMDEEFLRVGLDKRGEIMDVADEILSYVQESLRMSDFVFSNTAESELSGNDFTPPLQQPHIFPHLHHEPPLLQPQQPKPVPQQNLLTQMHQQQTSPQEYSHMQALHPQPVLQQQPHAREEVLTTQQHPHMRSLIPQQHPHGEMQQLCIDKHLHTQGYPQQLSSQQCLHVQASPWQSAPQKHACIQQQIPQKYDFTQQHPLSQTCPQKTAPQQHSHAQVHLQHQILQQHIHTHTLSQQQIPQPCSCSRLTSLHPSRREQPLVPQSQLHHQLDLLQGSLQCLAHSECPHAELSPLSQHQQQQGHLLQSSVPEQRRQLCHKEKHLQVNGKWPSLEHPVAVPNSNGQPAPPLLIADWSPSSCGHLAQGRSTLDLPYQSTVSIACSQDLSCNSSEELSAGEADKFMRGDLEELLESLQPEATVEQCCASIRQNGSDTPLYHPTALPTHQYPPETSGHQLNSTLLIPGTLGHQPFLLHFQNGSSGGISQADSETIGDIDLQHGPPLLLHLDESRPFQDLTIGGFI
ncbi:hypothetical protein GJAV_G00016350 [Gymnothorax javanicus]|nr:hypothetical protein GJAV_G00016350 [Gymnothorax javanicus]